MHPLKKQIGNQQCIVSYCTANEIVLEATMEYAAVTESHIIIEATANQVDQNGGYTGMRPHDFVAYAMQLAKKAKLSQHLLTLGGDHLGPLTWLAEPSHIAMQNAEDLVRAYVKAGFSKIHLDTSMRLADDLRDKPLSTLTIAKRGARLAKAALEAMSEGQELVFVIGSEVPVPGGTEDNEEGIHITTPTDFINTVDVYRTIFLEEGLKAAWENVIGVVVQPGVEFSDNIVFQYDQDAAAPLVRCLKQYPGLAFEGHSTDYQHPQSLTNMANDGVLILKVGPELTFSLREALLALTFIEEEMLPEAEHSRFRTVLDEVMLKEPKYWEKYYHGSEHEKKLARVFSLSDRCRYYLGQTQVKESIQKLKSNIDRLNIPPGLLHQHLPAANTKMTAHQMLKAHLQRGVISKFQTSVSAK